MSVQARTLSTTIPRRIGPYIWVVPSLVILAMFMFYPIGFTTLLSFFTWNGFGDSAFEEFVGLGNYGRALDDTFFFNAFRNTVSFAVSMVTIELFIAFVLATFIFQGRFRGGSWLRGTIFFPGVLSAVVVGLIWRQTVFLRRGLIDTVTTSLGLPAFFPLGDLDWAFYMIIMVGIWQNIGFNLIIFYAGLQSLDNEVLESAQIDGASFWQVMFRVIAPLQIHVILINVILNLVGSVKMFDLAYMLVQGHKGRSPIQVTHAADVFATYMHFNSFSGATGGGGMRKMGYAAAIAVFMIIVSLVFAVFRQGLRKRFDVL